MSKGKDKPELTWKEVLYKEPLEPPDISKLKYPLTKEESKILETAYDAAARKAARILFETALKNCMVGKVLGRVYGLHKHMQTWIYESLDKDIRHQIWQDRMFDLIDFLDYVLEKEAPEANKEIDEIGLSMFQAGWAIQASAYALAEEGYLDEYGFPKVGHLVEEGKCPRCHITIQKSWRKKTESP